MTNHAAVNLNQNDDVVQVFNAGGTSNILLICEHASNFIPHEYANLGLNEAARQSHVAWDPGALPIALMLSKQLDATLIASSISRLVYDCNRPPESTDAMPAQSELFDIPGNVNLNAAEKSDRIEKYYFPFRDTLESIIEDRAKPTVLITIHSFTPVFLGNTRSVEIGVLHDSDSKLAEALLAEVKELTVWNVQLNQPYDAKDGVTHTLRLHGIKNNLLNVMLEIRNDLISSEEQQARISSDLAGAIDDALVSLGYPKPISVTK